MDNHDADTAEGGMLSIFLLPDAGVRGAHVRLDGAWREIVARSEPAPAVVGLLGQAIAAAALMSAHAKVEGRLSVQLRSHGPLRSLVAECTAQGTIRGIVQMEMPVPAEPMRPDMLGDGALLAITIENPTPSGEPMRYQGLVELGAPTLAEALEGYFVQSEQLPTRLLLAADDNGATGLLLQKLPGAGEDADGWNRIGQLFGTLGADELQALDAGTLLHRLFHQEGLQRLGEKPLRFGCSCSRNRVEDVLRSLGQDEVEAAIVAGGGQAEVRCGFCGQRYLFSPNDATELFRQPAPNATPPDRLQ